MNARAASRYNTTACFSKGVSDAARSKRRHVRPVRPFSDEEVP